MTVLALEIYRLHTGAYPPSEFGLQWLREKPPPEHAAQSWRGPYLADETPIEDSWGRPLLYERSENGQTYVLKSLGPDATSPDDDLDARDLMPRLHEEMAKMPPLEPTPIP